MNQGHWLPELIKGCHDQRNGYLFHRRAKSGVRVRVFMIRDGHGQAARYEMPSRERTTDDRGVYRIYGLAPGTYVASAGGGSGFSGYNINPYDADVPTYAPAATRDTATEINLHSGEEVTGIDSARQGT
jgi:hypothetical protein